MTGNFAQFQSEPNINMDKQATPGFLSNKASTDKVNESEAEHNDYPTYGCMSQNMS